MAITLLYLIPNLSFFSNNPIASRILLCRVSSSFASAIQPMVRRLCEGSVEVVLEISEY
ncbi:MAG: hypothetical protein Q7T47_00245 [Anaerolineales bacterium]|nr:hypothetical protein [Anaerolineales bacterium]